MTKTAKTKALRVAAGAVAEQVGGSALMSWAGHLSGVSTLWELAKAATGVVETTAKANPDFIMARMNGPMMLSLFGWFPSLKSAIAQVCPELKPTMYWSSWVWEVCRQIWAAIYKPVLCVVAAALLGVAVKAATMSLKRWMTAAQKASETELNEARAAAKVATDKAAADELTAAHMAEVARVEERNAIVSIEFDLEHILPAAMQMVEAPVGPNFNFPAVPAVAVVVDGAAETPAIPHQIAGDNMHPFVAFLANHIAVRFCMKTRNPSSPEAEANKQVMRAWGVRKLKELIESGALAKDIRETDQRYALEAAVALACVPTRGEIISQYVLHAPFVRDRVAAMPHVVPRIGGAQ